MFQLIEEMRTSVVNLTILMKGSSCLPSRNDHSGVEDLVEIERDYDMKDVRSDWVLANGFEK
jgi:hypothetical protein